MPGRPAWLTPLAMAALAVSVFEHWLRYVLPEALVVPWTWQASYGVDRQAFAAMPGPFVVYALTLGTTLASGPAAVARVLAGRAPGYAFLVAASLAAIAGAVLAAARGAGMPGGPAMQFYYYGMALLWLVANVRAATAHERGNRLVARDWTLYSFAVALAPAGIVVTAPVWSLLEVMSVDDACVTAATMTTAGLYLAAHFCICELLDARTPSRAASG